MPDLPTGTVTFLFTDVEGSTRLLERLGERYRDVQHRHDAIIRGAIADGDGREVSTEGDSFFAVFPSPAGAVQGAVEAQRELAATTWPEGAAVRVRMGLHTGEGSLGGDNYLGLDVNRAARIAEAAHGGQILISDATRSLIERRLPPGTRLRDLGRHRLKDLTQPERLYQVVIEGLEQDFPQPRALDARPNNLPVQLTRFIGRSDEIAQIGELLVSNRLVTLIGPGGTGKTRLALQVAAEALADFGDGVFFVDLSAVTIPELVPAAIAAALDVREEPGRPMIDALGDYLRDKELLLVLDNFEQVVEAGAGVLEPLLRIAPEVKALVTSRLPLHLYGEQEFPVPPLALPDPQHLPDLEALRLFEAIALFVARAAGAKPDFRLTADNARAVAEITARLDGLPLAIELAASRVKLLPPQALLARLRQRLPLLSAQDRNVPERQRTLRRTIEWSYELLDDAEQRMFARLAVFTGGAELEAVEAVVNPDGELGLDALEGLASLVDNNLVRSVGGPEGEPRFTMLETIREYGLERLSEWDEESAFRRRHAEHWIEVVEQAAEGLAGPDQAAWTRRLEHDHDNFRSALSWALQSGEAELGLRLAATLRDFWRLGSHVREGVRWLRELLALPAAAGRTLLRARALTVAGELHGWIGDPEAYLRYAEEAVAIYRDLGDSRVRPEALAALGWAQLQVGRLEAARASLREAKELYIGQGDRQEVGESNMALGILAFLEGRANQARPLYEDALETFKDLRNTYFVALVEGMLGQVDGTEGKFEAAAQRYRTSLSTYRQIDNLMGTAWVLYSFAHLALLRGQHERALRLVGASDALLEGVGELPALVSATMGDVGAAARSFLDEATAKRVYQEGLAMELEDAVAYAVQQQEA
ncbi:MAG: AAA family ATPase [Actinomycetota bacterium]|nr:AAA family ATPase [Actinomycetota bacterium]